MPIRKKNDFNGKDLRKKKFSRHDIRGVDFRGANLTGAKFKNSRAGLSPSWEISLKLSIVFLSLLAGLIAAYSGAIIGHLVTDESNGMSLFGFIAGLILATFLLVIKFDGFGIILFTLSEITAASLIATIAFLPDNSNELILGAEFTALGLIGAIAAVGNISLATAISQETSFLKSYKAIVFLALLGAILGALCGVRQEVAFLISGLVSIVVIGLGYYVGWEAMRGNEQNQKNYWIIRFLALATIAKGGTKFDGADLTDVDFRGANVPYTSFRNVKGTTQSSLKEATIGYDERIQELEILRTPNLNKPPQIIVKEQIMGDQYKVNQAGAVGPQAHAHDMTFNQIGTQLEKSVDLLGLANELSILRKAMMKEATEAEHSIAVGDVAKAEQAAKSKDATKVAEYLKSAGNWALDIASQIGVPIAIEALKRAIGIPL